MPVSRLFLLLALSLTSLLDAQSLRIYSEFYRIDPFGKPIPADSVPTPREIISPAVARNGFSSFRILVTAPPAVPFTLHIAQNPDNTAEIKLYREIYTKSGETWIPDRLEPVEVPYTGTVAQAVRTIPGQSVQSFWLDARLPATVPPTRFRLEAQLNINQQWIIYPLEVRVQQTVLPTPPESKTGLSPLESASDSPALSVLREYLCGAPSGKPEPDLSVRQFIRRNALQDAALARDLEPSRTRQLLQQTLLWSAGFPDLTPAAWCKAPKRPEGAGSEWYLKVRQYLLSGKR